MTVRFRTAARSDVGRMRRGNEDAFLVVDALQLVAVADGMGGHQAGEVASATAIAALGDEMERGEPIDAAITAANGAVFAEAGADESLRGMGTTLTAGILKSATFVIGHVGDSRAYLLRTGELRQLTTDHSVVAELIASGEITEAEARVDPRRSMITRALGIDEHVAVDVLEVELEPGDRLLLCSDGLTTMIHDEAIADILGAQDRDRAAAELVDAANLAGGADNITVVVIDVVDADGTDAELVEGLDEALDDGFWAPDAPDAPEATDATLDGDDGGDDGDEGDDHGELAGAAAEATSADEPGPARRRWWPRRSPR